MAYARPQGNALGLDDDETKAMEQTRQRLYQLSNSIQSFRQSVAQSNPLPPSASLHAQYQILLRNLESLLEILNENAVPFAHTSVHPAVNYPGRTQENVLLTLLRKKREPGVEELVEKGLETTAEVRASSSEGDIRDGIQRLEEIWEELREWTDERVSRYVMEGEATDIYTRKERDAGVENVRTGLRRALDGDDEEDEDEDEGEDEDEDGESSGKKDGQGDVAMDGAQQQQQQQQQQQPAQAAPEPELLLWFAARGDYDLPPNVQLEKDAAKRARLAKPGGMPRM